MFLLLEELDTGGTLFQEMKTKDRTVQVAAIRPHIYRQDLNVGNLFVEVQDMDGRAIATSNKIPINSMGSLIYFHGYVRFDINVSLKANTVYRIALKPADGYVLSATNYVGWCSDYDLQKYGRNYTPAGDYEAARDMEIWERKVIQKG